MFEGVHTALITPFRFEALDESALRTLIDQQFDAGVSGVVPVGTTGESPTLHFEEHLRVIELAVEATAGRGQVIAGTGANSTSEAIELTKAAARIGATASLQVAPYYNKPSQEGLFQHFKAIADSTDLPIVLYSIPGRCGIEIGVETVARLAEACPTIKAIKEAGGTPERISQLAQVVPDDFELLSGDDSMTLPFMSVGGVGVISVASNIIPGPMSQLVAAALEGDYRKAGEMHQKYYPLLSALLKLDTNPVPIKTAVALTGLTTEEIRLPMVPITDAKRSELETVLRNLDVI